MRSEAVRHLSKAADQQGHRAPKLVPALETSRHKAANDDELVPDSGERRKAEPRVIINEDLALPQKSTLGEVFQGIQTHFLNASALGEYLDYLKQQKEEGSQLDTIELPNGEKFSDLHWNKKDLTQLIRKLEEHLDTQTQVAFVKGKMKEALPDEDEIMRRGYISQTEEKQAELEKIINTVDSLQARLEATQASKTTKDRITNVLAWLPWRGSRAISETEKEIRAIKAEIDRLEQESHRLEEDIQMDFYKTQNWDKRLKKTTAEKDIPPPSKELLQSKDVTQIRERFAPMTKEEVMRRLDAYHMWEFVHTQIAQHPTILLRIENLPHMQEFGVQDPAQNYVYAVARWLRAQDMGDTDFANTIKKSIDTWNGWLNMNNTQFYSWIKTITIKNTLEGTQRRQENTRRSNRRWKV